MLRAFPSRLASEASQPNRAWPKRPYKGKPPLVGRSFEFGWAYFRLSVPHLLTAFALGLAFSPQFCPAFLLSSSNRRSARCGDAFALAGSSGTTRCGLGGAVLLPSLRPIPLHPDADGTPFSGGHLSTPGPGAILRRCSTVVPVAQIRKCPEQFIPFGPKLREPGLRPFSGKRFHVDRHVGMISTVDSRSKRRVSRLVRRGTIADRVRRGLTGWDARAFHFPGRRPIIVR